MGGNKNAFRPGEYRGRGRSGGRVRTVLLFIIALLTVLLVAGVAFMAFMSQYLEYTPDGVIVHWPWVQGETPAPLPIASDPLEVVTDPADVTAEPSLEVEPVEPTPEPTPEPPQYTAVSAVTVTTGQLRSGAAAQAVLSAGGGTLVVEMKDEYGYLEWQSQVPLAATMGVNAGDNRTAQAVRELADAGDLYLVARVTCFRDPALARNWVDPLMTRGGNVWYDRVGICWSSPASQRAADYISALCLELADMGFDEIVLDCAGYPTDGQVSVLAVSDNRPEDLTVPVSAFLSRVAGELKERGVCLGVFTGETLEPGAEVLSGLTAEVLAQNAGRVWLDASVSPWQYTELLTAAGFDNTGARIVSPNNTSGSWYR